MPNRGKTAASKNPNDPFRPALNHPKTGGSDGKMQAQSTFGKQLVPISDGKREFKLPNKRQGFAGVARRTKMDQGSGVAIDSSTQNTV